MFVGGILILSPPAAVINFRRLPVHPVMRGQQERSGSLFSYVSIEERIPASHPLRRIRRLADQALDRLNPTFCALYAAEGRPSVPPE